MINQSAETVSFEMVGPDQAKAWLATNLSNRRVEKYHVNKLANAMTKGDWSLNGQTITFNTEGALIDGQHRLMAVVQSGVAVPMAIVRGVKPNVITTIDTGKPRSLGDIMGMHGFSSIGKFAGSIRLCIAYLDAMMTSKSVYSLPHSLRMVSHTDSFRFLVDHPEIEDSVAIGKKVHQNQMGSHVAVPAAHWIISQRNDRSHVDDFFTLLGTGEGLPLASPIYALRSKMIRDRVARVQPIKGMLLLYIIRAWNAWASGQTLSLIRAGDGIFPDVKTKSSRTRTP